MSFFTERRLQTGLWIGIGLALLVLMYLLAPVLTPFALAGIFAYLLVPGVDWIAARRIGRFAIPRWAGALAMILLTGLLVFGLLLLLIPVLQKEVIALQARFPAVVDHLNTTVAPKLAAWFGIELQFDAATLRELLTERVGNQDFFAQIVSRLRTGGAALLGVVGLLFLVPAVLFYMLLDYHDFLRRIEVLIPRRWHATTMAMLAEIDSVLAQFLRGQLSVMLALAVYYAAALAIARFDTALPIGILTGLLIFIPYVGFALGLVLALIAAALQFGNLYGFAAVAVIYGVGQLVESFVLTPRLVGERIGLHPIAVIFALLAFGQVFGFFGVLLALPASAALLVGLRHLRDAYIASDFYRGDPPTIPLKQPRPET
jgi:predicted PurR-regulated permease PerM